MAEVIRMPRLSDTMEEGNIIGWLKKVGEKVSPGDVLAEVETDKATMDLESFHEGVLLYIGVKEGAVPVDGIIAVIGKEGEEYESLIKEDNVAPPGEAGREESKENPSSADQQAQDKSSGQENKQEGQKDASSNENVKEYSEEPSVSSDRIKASPLAKSMAKEKNIDLAKVKGSGEGGRIVKRDIEEAESSAGTSTTPVQAASYSAMSTGKSKEIPLSQMRKTIARRLSESKFGAPHFYLTIEINMDRSVEARNAINAIGLHKISFNDIVVKASALALRTHPMINASWYDDKIVVNGDINVGVAVAVEEGLLVPVINNADIKPMHVINAEVKEKAGRAREKRLKPEEMQGNTFTISNLGMFGIDEFTAIINPPDSCILAVGGIIQKPIVVNGSIKVGNMMKVTLSCDHRVVDGATGAAYLQTLQSYLENPLQMLV